MQAEGEADKMTDLFGNEITVEEARGNERKGKRKGNRKDDPRGNAAPIGTGPDGETCGTCKHCWARRMSKRYYKCGLVRSTGGPKTDIRLKWAACSRWEARTVEADEKGKTTQ